MLQFLSIPAQQDGAEFQFHKAYIPPAMPTDWLLEENPDSTVGDVHTKIGRTFNGQKSP